MDEESSLSPAGLPYFRGVLSGQELQALSLRLWQLLSRRTARYTLGDSSSVPLETAEQLLASIGFTLNAYLRETGSAPALLLSADLDALLDRGFQILENRLKKGRLLWQAACLGAPAIPNTYLQITLKSIGGFFHRYDHRFFAHQIPCDIVYQLCHPVPDACLGIDYIIDYLRRLIAENHIISRFETGLVRSLLARALPGYEDLPANLCEPIIINGIGLALIGGDISALGITAGQRAEIDALLRPLPEPEALAALTEAAGSFCRACGLTDRFTLDYAACSANELYPRLSAALESGHLEEIFVSPVSYGG